MQWALIGRGKVSPARIYYSTGLDHKSSDTQFLFLISYGCCVNIVGVSYIISKTVCLLIFKKVVFDMDFILIGLVFEGLRLSYTLQKVIDMLA